jgi:hypothetical protein
MNGSRNRGEHHGKWRTKPKRKRFPLIDRIRNDQILEDFPRPPSRTQGLDVIAEEQVLSEQPYEEQAYPTPRPSLKNMRRNVTTNELPLLQEINPYEHAEEFNPVSEEGASYDLIAPWDGVDAPLHKLERLSDVMFGTEHMLSILNNPRYLARFREFLLEERPRSISTLTYYLNAVKALKALEYANALVRLSIDVPPPAVQLLQRDNEAVGETVNKVLEQRVEDGLNALTAEELPAFITSRCITITSKIVEERVRGTLPMKFRETSNALAEVFCLTDPSRPDNPIIFASQGTTPGELWLGLALINYRIPPNNAIWNGLRPWTQLPIPSRPKDESQQRTSNSRSIECRPTPLRALPKLVHAQSQHPISITILIHILYSRRDGSPFMNLLQCAPLCDSKGRVKYVIGAQIDVSGLTLDGAQMESLIELQSRYRDPDEESVAEMPIAPHKDEFRQMCELFSPKELSAVQEHGGDLFQPLNTRASSRANRHWIPRGGSMDSEMEAIRLRDVKSPLFRGLTGVYENVSTYTGTIYCLLSLFKTNRIFVVPPCPTLPLPPRPFHVPVPSDPRHATIIILLSHWKLVSREGRAHGCDATG